MFKDGAAILAVRRTHRWTCVQFDPEPPILESLAPTPGNETVECVSLRKLQYVRRRCVRSANTLVLERLHRPPQLAASSIWTRRAMYTERTCGRYGLMSAIGSKADIAVGGCHLRF